MVENFLNIKKKVDNQVQEAQEVPNKMNLNGHKPKCVTVKMAKVKEF